MALFDHHHPWVLAFGILGNLVSIFVFFSPLPTFVRICKEKSTMGFQSLPYVVALFSAMLWMYYALLKEAFLLISINSLGCIIQTIYIFIYILYAAREARKQTVKLLATLNVGMFSTVFLLTHFAFNQSTRITIVGWICVAFSVSVFAAPLSIVFQVVRTRSTEFMPFALSFTLTLSAILWFSYGLLQKDICVAVPNILGFILGLLQMLLYGLYRNAKPIAVEKKIPQYVIDIVMLGNSDQVHPVDSQTSSCCGEAVAAAADHDDEKKNQEKDGSWGENNVAIPVAPDDDEPSRQVNMQPDSPPPVLVVCAAA